MKKLFTAIAMIAIAALISMPVDATTLYQQEGTVSDGPSPIDATGQGPNGDDSDNWTNWKYQYGGGSWSGVYAASDGWLEESSSGDMELDIEADIELYYTESISGNKVYFHIGNIYDALAHPNRDLTALVNGSFTTNNGMYIGLCFLGTSKDESSFEKDTGGNYTGVILDGMQSDNDSWRVQNNQMDLQILLSWDGGSTWAVPVAYGDGAHSTITDTLWWLVDGGNAGTYNYTWKIILLPEPHQPDGDYYLDPQIVAAPTL
jgi:hypothetical protein